MCRRKEVSGGNLTLRQVKLLFHVMPAGSEKVSLTFCRNPCPLPLLAAGKKRRNEMMDSRKWSSLSVLIPKAHLPVIFGCGFKGHTTIINIADGSSIKTASCVPYKLIECLVERCHNLIRGLEDRILFSLQSPAERRFPSTDSDRIFFVFT